MKPRIRDVWGDLEHEAIPENDDYHAILSPLLDKVAVNFADLDYILQSIRYCAKTYDGTRFLQNIVHEAQDNSVTTSHRLELLLEAVQESVLELVVDEYGCHLIDTRLPSRDISNYPCSKN